MHCAAPGDQRPCVATERIAARPRSPDASVVDPERCAAWFAAALLPTDLLDVTLVALFAWTRPDEREDDFVSNFWRRVFRGPGPH